MYALLMSCVCAATRAIAMSQCACGVETLGRLSTYHNSIQLGLALKSNWGMKVGDKVILWTPSVQDKDWMIKGIEWAGGECKFPSSPSIASHCVIQSDANHRAGIVVQKSEWSAIHVARLIKTEGYLGILVHDDLYEDAWQSAKVIQGVSTERIANLRSLRKFMAARLGRVELHHSRHRKSQSLWRRIAQALSCFS